MSDRINVAYEASWLMGLSESEYAALHFRSIAWQRYGEGYGVSRREVPPCGTRY